MNNYWRWRDLKVSAGFYCPDGAKTICIPSCNLCVNGSRLDDTCKIYGDIPQKYADGSAHDCPYAMLDTANDSYESYVRLHGEPDPSHLVKK